MQNIYRKVDIENIIEEMQVKKTNLLLELGILAYNKIRNNDINDEEFNELKGSIIEIDKIIYENSIKLISKDVKEKESFCECGHSIGINDKYCVECGSKIELEIVECKTCNNCDTKLNLDDNYCICCGHKI